MSDPGNHKLACDQCIYPADHVVLSALNSPFVGYRLVQLPHPGGIAVTHSDNAGTVVHMTSIRLWW